MIYVLRIHDTFIRRGNRSQQLAKGTGDNLLWDRHIKAPRATTEMHWSRRQLREEISLELYKKKC